MKKLVSFVRESAWAPYALKIVGIALALTGVAFLGSGVLDRWLSLQPAFASSAARASATVSAAREGRPRSTAIPTGSTSASAPERASARAASAAPAVSGSAAPAAAVPSAITSDGRVVLNLAGEKELMTLPGIGARKAQAILELRAKLGGRFKRVEDLTRIRGIKRRFLERLRPKVVLDAE